jgi:hypothetical protein
LLLAVAMCSPEAIAPPLDIWSADDMEPLDIAPGFEVPSDIVPVVELCATAAPTAPALKARASPVILANRSI